MLSSSCLTFWLEEDLRVGPNRLVAIAFWSGLFEASLNLLLSICRCLLVMSIFGVLAVGDCLVEVFDSIEE